jgi:excisionase family DNA binding protein
MQMVPLSLTSELAAASNAEALISRREAARYLGVSETTLAIWKCTGRYSLPFVKIGRLVKYRKIDLDRFISRNLANVS